MMVIPGLTKSCFSETMRIKSLKEVSSRENVTEVTGDVKY